MNYLTIIVPIYNTEKYLPECLDSIKNQSFKSFQCIMIDDGSSDNSSNICQHYVDSDKRFLLIKNEKNIGLLKTREKALKFVKTDFVSFVDSDDVVPQDGFEELILKQKETNAKVVIGSLKYTDMERNEIGRIIRNSIKIEDPLRLYFTMRAEINHNATWLWSVWAKIYNTDLFKDIIYPSFTMGEDQCLNVQICNKLKGNEIYFLEKIVYEYRTNPDSVTQQEKRNLNKPLSEYSEMIWVEWIKKWLIDIGKFDQYEFDFIENIYLVKLGTFLIRENKIRKEDLSYIKSIYKKYKSKIKLHGSQGVAIKLYYYVPVIAMIANRFRKFLKNSFIK